MANFPALFMQQSKSCLAVKLGNTLAVSAAQHGRLNQRRLLQQPVAVTPIPAAATAATSAAAAAAATCSTIRDTQLQAGPLCVSQLITTTATEVLCDRYEPACVKSTTRTAMLNPSGDALSNPAGFQQSADAACKVLGYAAAGSGSVHMTGPNAKRTCW
jgi:hypothetical protein